MLWEFNPKPCYNTWSFQRHFSPLHTATIKGKHGHESQKLTTIMRISNAGCTATSGTMSATHKPTGQWFRHNS